MPDAKTRKTNPSFGDKREDRISAVENGNMLREELSGELNTNRVRGKIFNFSFNFHTTI